MPDEPPDQSGGRMPSGDIIRPARVRQAVGQEDRPDRNRNNARLRMSSVMASSRAVATRAAKRRQGAAMLLGGRDWKAAWREGRR